MKLKFEAIKGLNGIRVLNNKGIQLGVIGYYKEWKEYVYEQMPEIVMSEKCLKQVYEKIVQLNLLNNCKTK
jgi:hypothetical protein